ncbi:DMT family transporter [Aureimonas fodinaquatilis]|uniref:DMT family transporter n=1 Tax=Aureimonas fodinaquatilis TaxID=2565783 RepID=A0A5B0DYY9_9HYPH|nr:DMT family transporter [Aureimonas fodinaquatilis]KAA0971656.1 DMT family transporter [Aureimonas fodinaquatilis]
MKRLVMFFPALFVIVWSTGFIGSVYAMPYAEPFVFLVLRFSLAIVLLLLLVVTANAPWPKPKIAAHSMIVGALIHGVYLGGIFFAVRYGLPAGIAALIAGMQPILTALMAAAFLGEAINRRQWIGLVLGLVGVALVIVPKLGGNDVYSALTLIPAAMAAMGIAVGTIWQKKFGGSTDLRTGSILQYCGALILVAPLAIGLESWQIEWTGELIFALIWLSVVLSIGAIFMLMFMIREGAVSKVASLMYLTPGVTAVMAFILFGETLSLVQLCGLVLAGIGVAAAVRSKRV